MRNATHTGPGVLGSCLGLPGCSLEVGLRERKVQSDREAASHLDINTFG